jgi:hypothetical protein
VLADDSLHFALLFPLATGQRKAMGVDSKNLQAQRNIAVAVFVVLFKHVRHSLQTDARLHKQVEAHGVLPTAVVGAVQQRDELLREAVSECDEGFVELGVRDAAAVVGVEAVEEAAPGGEEPPEATVGEEG